MKIIIDRIDANEYQTEGFLRLFDEKDEVIFHCKTLELPWRNNERRVSRIPDGTYQAIKHQSPKFGNSIWIQNVPDRSEILIHLGNYNRDTLGCILVGKEFIDIDGDGQYDVTASKVTMDELYALASNNLTVEIRNRYGQFKDN